MKNEKKQKTTNKMADQSLNVAIITLNVNGLTIPTETQIDKVDQKIQSNNMLSVRNSLQI